MLDSTDMQKLADLLDWKLEEKLDHRFKTFEKRLDAQLDRKLEEKITPFQNFIHILRRKMKIMILFFDGECIEMKKRLDRLDKLLELPPLP